MLALIYVRVSTEEQAKRGFSIPEQLAECRARAAGLGATEVVELVDELGGDFLERPQLLKARELVRSKQVRWFICYDPDRFSRNLLNQLLVTDEIDKSGAELIFVQHHRQKTPEGNLFYAIRGAIAEFEKKKILERTQRGKRGKAKQGLLPGYVNPYGYTMDTETDQLVVNELEAAWVRNIFAWASDPDPAERMGQWRIAERLNSMGVPAPRGRHWYRSTVAGILHNPLYTGVLRWGRYDHTGIYQARRAGAPRPKRVRRPDDQVVDLPVPPIISPDVFQRVHAYIQLDKYRRSRGNVYPLTGIAICGRCGGRIQSKQSGSRYLVCANRYPEYREMSDQRRAMTAPCDLPHLKAERVEAFVWETVCNWLQHPEALQLAASSGRAGCTPDQPLRSELETVGRQIADLEQAQARILALVARAHIRQELAVQQVNEMAEQIRRLRLRQAELEAELAGAARAESPPPHAISPAGGLADEIRRCLPLLPPERSVQLIRRLVASVVIHGNAQDAWEVVPITVAGAGS